MSRLEEIWNDLLDKKLKSILSLIKKQGNSFDEQQDSFRVAASQVRVYEQIH